MASLILLPSSILTWRVYSLCCSLSTASFSSALSDSHSPITSFSFALSVTLIRSPCSASTAHTNTATA